jgi:hypothetical protein
MENIEDPNALPVAGAVAKLLGNNHAERNVAIAELNNFALRFQKLKQAKHDLAFELYGRLAKYDPSVFDEVALYVANNDVYYYTSSDKIGVLSNIKYDKWRPTEKAHHTVYGRVIKKCSSDDEEPIAYNDRFIMKHYMDKFAFNQGSSEYKKVEDFFIPIVDLMHEEAPVEEAHVEEAPISVTIEDAPVATEDVTAKPKRKYTRKPKV